ncbi:hypothetical protein TIFTF001_016295 [Ficus carica]|uniref:Protein RAE1 n=1 Tax=Ficus carica TaxID=3494 RepID=A0AA88A035_FICCA|nr:hypothetical protein TIFTF001_016295 [Ficus carica]
MIRVLMESSSWQEDGRCGNEQDLNEIVTGDTWLSSVRKVTQPPSDSVSSVTFSPKANHLVATSWDNQVRCWEIMRNGNVLGSSPKASISHDQPVLCSTWKDDGTTVFSGGCDKQVKMWPLLSGGQAMTVAMHDAPIKEVAWIPEMSLLVTGSWDKTLKYWDTRQPNPVHTQQLPDRCYALTVRHPLMVVGTADRNLIVFNLQSPQTEFKRIMSPLKYQTRCVAAFPDQQGFLVVGLDFLVLLFPPVYLIVGSIEGRVGVHHLDDSQQSKNFTFKCHRDGTEIYSVNSLNFHPVHHTFATAGSDGAYNFWDKDSKQRLKAMSRCSQPIPCSTFNNDGSIFAYSVCYDWSKGAENHNPATAKTYIYLHLPQESEVKGKPRVGTSGRNFNFYPACRLMPNDSVLVLRQKPSRSAFARRSPTATTTGGSTSFDFEVRARATTVDSSGESEIGVDRGDLPQNHAKLAVLSPVPPPLPSSSPARPCWKISSSLGTS